MPSVLLLTLVACDALRWEPTLAIDDGSDDTAVVLPDTGEGICPEYQGGGVVTWYRDADDDGWGAQDAWQQCDVQPDGYVLPRDIADQYAWDCDDDDPAINPEAEEICGDSIDQDCDGYDAYERTYYYDDDDDGHWSLEGTRACEDSGSGARISPGGDCDDTDPDIHPDAEDVCGDEIDQDCDGEDFVGALWFADDDGDGFGGDEIGQACEEPSSGVLDDRDCDDTDAAVNPDADEVCGDGVDNDCVGGDDEGPTWYPDADGDSYADLDAGLPACEQPEGWLSGGRDDCDDADPAVNPGEVEVCGDGLDNDCDGTEDVGDTWFADLDGDGWGDYATSSVSCEAPLGYVDNDEDCDDTDATVSPDGTEVCGDGLDNDCNDGDDLGDTWYADGDGDGYGDPVFSTESCDEPLGYVDNTDDCDDLDADVNPGAEEVCGDGVDNDCDEAAAGCGLYGALSIEDAAQSWYGEAAGDHAGWSLAVAGDLDGDGVSEVLVGAPYEATQGTNAGAAYLIGPDDAEDLGSATAVMLAEDDQDRAGYAVGSVGDWNEDGVGDLLVGAIGQDGLSASGGAAYLVLGPVSGQLLLEDADLVARGSASAGMGLQLAGGDQDGDGAPELAVGAYLAGDGGELYLFASGGSGELADTDAEVVVRAAASGDDLAHGLVGGEDVDGDGLSDWIVGAPQVGSADGEVYVFYGPLTADLTAADADAVWAGVDEQAGYALAFTEDLDGDGRVELLVGAPSSDAGATSAGGAYLVDPALSGDRDLADATAAVGGGSSYDYIGRVLSGSADLTGDGDVDVVVGTDNGSGLYVFAGPLSGTLSVDDDAWGSIEGTRRADLTSVVGPGDWDGDGEGDLVVGAGADDEAGTDAGAVYLLLGGEGL